jgi:light-regulated signal transduction histidine kinase (bacteriophytochrome)
MPAPGKYGTIFTGTLIPLVFFTLFFVINAILGYFSIRNVANAQAQVNQARININLIHELHLEVLRAETGQRGFLLTGLDSYGAPFFEAATAIETRLMNLGSAQLDAEQGNLFYQLQTLVDEELTELTSIVEATRNDNQMDALRELLTHRGRELMEDIAELAIRMEMHERGLLAVRMQSAADSRNTAFMLILAANFVGLAMVFVSLAMIRGSKRKELEFLSGLQEAKDNLELKVDERTAVLQHYSNELKRSNRELQDFAFVASHDLQEPLRKIRAFGDRLQQGFAAQLDEQGADYIERMQNASTRMSGLIDDLLSFSRITTKAKPFLPVSLNKVAEEVLEDLEVAIEESAADIRVGELPEIAADQFQMKQLFQNLLGNALKFRRPDVRPEISITAELVAAEAAATETSPQHVVLRFTDNGIGFDEAFLDRVFLPFQRLHGRSEYGGTGIGLAICRRIAERHNGSLTAVSTPGVGSTFIVTLPVRNQSFAVGEPA